MTEIWRAVLGYEGKYEVSNLGNVRSLNWEGVLGRVHILSRNISRSPRNKIGYNFVRLSRERRTKPFRVGRLVLTSFVRPPYGKEEQNHLDGNSLNDRVDNLEWQTRSGNQKHAIASGLAKPPPQAHPLNSGKQYGWKHKDGRIIRRTCMEMARLVGADGAPFFKMVSGKEQPHKSFYGWSPCQLPSPGSNTAIDNFCSCPCLDNHYGLGYNGIEGLFVFNMDCPLHGGVR